MKRRNRALCSIPSFLKQWEGKELVKIPKQHAGLYIRVSTDAQFEEGYSVDAQKEMLAAYCKTKQISSYQFYIDGGFTGSNIERPEMQRLMNDVRDGRISHVIVYKLDRLSRSQKDTLYLIEDVFNPNQVDFVSLNENMDTSTPIGRAMLGIMSAFAQLERETIRERTRMGMKERVKNGYWMGGGRIPFGYDYDREQGILIPNEDAKTVKKIYDLYLQGYSPERIAHLAGLKYERLAIQILTRKTNAGFICYNGEEYPGRHEPIISLETYEKAMALMKERSVKRFTDSHYLLSGLVYCGKCGAKMRYQKWGKNGCKLCCYSQQKSKPYLIKDPDCDNEKPWADEVEEAVIADLMQISLEERNAVSPAQPCQVLDLLEEQAANCANKIKRLYNLYAQDGNPLLLETIEENQLKLQELQNQVKREQEWNETSKKSHETKEMLTGIRNIWGYMTPHEKQHFLRQCIQKVVVTGETVEVFYQFLC